MNNWTAASKKQKPLASNSSRKLLSVALWSERLPIHPQKIDEGKSIGHAAFHVLRPRSDLSRTVIAVQHVGYSLAEERSDWTACPVRLALHHCEFCLHQTHLPRSPGVSPC